MKTVDEDSGRRQRMEAVDGGKHQVMEEMIICIG